MAAYQFYNPAPVFFDLLGLQPISNGSITFYERGTTTDKNTWQEPELTTVNENPVPLGPGGRLTAPVFLDGDYTAVIKDALGAVIATRDIIGGGVAGQTIPALLSGQFLTNDGSNLSWATVRQLPDPTGFTNHYLTTDGANFFLTPIPAAPTIPDLQITVGTTSFQAGVSTDETKWLAQMGSATAPATGSNTTTVSVTFPTVYSTRPYVFLTPTSDSNPGGPMVGNLTATPTTTGFTARYDVAEGTSGGANVVNPVPFDWVAFGTKEVA